MKNYKRCPICFERNLSLLTRWTFYCSKCDHWISEQKVYLNRKSDLFFKSENFEDNPIFFLQQIRLETSRIILSQLRTLNKGNLLDVGCASGFFLEQAQNYGFKVTGIEPNKKMASYAIKKKLPVIVGFFPGALKRGEKYSFITFNDVLEHIEDIDSIIEGSYNSLISKGYLSINVPNSHGIFFRIGAFLSKFRYFTLWNRLWQVMFYTPHLHYFSPASLTNIVEKHSFSKIIGPTDLPVISIKNLWHRISAAPNLSFFEKSLQYLFFIFFYPIYKISTKDSFFIVFQKK
jgi:hypothetical protein